MNIEKNLAKDDYFPLRVKSIANQEQACHGSSDTLVMATVVQSFCNMVGFKNISKMFSLNYCP